MWASSSKLGSMGFQIFTKTEKIKEEGAFSSLQTGIAKYHSKKDVHVYSSFKHNIWNIQLGSRVYTIIGIYHPPQGTDQPISHINFTDQFTDLLTEEVPKHQDLIIMGGINIPTNDMEDQDAKILLDTIAAFNLKQHLNVLTHNLGHTLDLIITPATYEVILKNSNNLWNSTLVLVED